MGLLSRVKQKIFGSTGSVGEFGKIGSDNLGVPATTKDLALIQSLSPFDEGLFQLTSSGGQPPRIQDLNSLYYLITSQLVYIFQTGIAEWDSTTEYYNLISFVTKGGIIYQSLSGTDGSPNVGHDPSSDIVNWRTNDAVVEKARALTAEALLAPKASPAFTGTPTAPTPAANDNSTKIATTAYSDAGVLVEKTRALAAEAGIQSQVTTLASLTGSKFTMRVYSPSSAPFNVPDDMAIGDTVAMFINPINANMGIFTPTFAGRTYCSLGLGSTAFTSGTSGVNNNLGVNAQILSMNPNVPVFIILTRKS